VEKTLLSHTKPHLYNTVRRYKLNFLGSQFFNPFVLSWDARQPEIASWRTTLQVRCQILVVHLSLLYQILADRGHNNHVGACFPLQ